MKIIDLVSCKGILNALFRVYSPGTLGLNLRLKNLTISVLDPLGSFLKESLGTVSPGSTY